MTWHFWRTAWQTHSVSPFVFSISIRLLALDQNRFCCRRITIMIAGDTGSCLCKGPWSKLAVTIPNVWSSYIHCHDLLWNICGLICLHVLAILHACLFPQMQREREREGNWFATSLPPMHVQRNHFSLWIFGNLKETYCWMQIQNPISPKWMEGDERLGRPNARGQLVSQMLAGDRGLWQHSGSHSTWFLAVGRLLPGLKYCKLERIKFPSRPIRIHVNCQLVDGTFALAPVILGQWIRPGSLEHGGDPSRFSRDIRHYSFET